MTDERSAFDDRPGDASEAESAAIWRGSRKNACGRCNSTSAEPPTTSRINSPRILSRPRQASHLPGSELGELPTSPHERPVTTIQIDHAKVRTGSGPVGHPGEQNAEDRSLKAGPASRRKSERVQFAANSTSRFSGEMRFDMAKRCSRAEKKHEEVRDKGERLDKHESAGVIRRVKEVPSRSTRLSRSHAPTPRLSGIPRSRQGRR